MTSQYSVDYLNNKRGKVNEIFFFFFFWTGLCVPIECSLLGGGIPYQKTGYKGTRIYTTIVLSFYLVLPVFINGRSSLTFPIPPPHFVPPLRLTSPLLSPSPSPSPIRPAPTTNETPTPLVSEQTDHRDPESFVSQYTVQPYSDSL